MTSTHRRRRGFSFIELMVTIVVLTIVLAFGAPALADLIAQTRLTAVANTLLGHLQYARSEAVKRGRDWVAVGPCNDEAQCKPDTDWPADQVWQDGYMVAIVDAASSPTVLRVLRRIEADELESVTIDKNGSAPRFLFAPDGSASVASTLTICDRRNPTHRRGVVVDMAGRVRITQYKPGSGEALTCP